MNIPARATFTFKDGSDEITVYREHDGDPVNAAAYITDVQQTMGLALAAHDDQIGGAQLIINALREHAEFHYVVELPEEATSMDDLIVTALQWRNVTDSQPPFATTRDLQQVYRGSLSGFATWAHQNVDGASTPVQQPKVAATGGSRR